MAQFINNLRLNIVATAREEVTRFFTEGILAKHKSYGHFDVFTDAHLSVGVFYVEPEKALTQAQYTIAPWLEFLVDDVPAAEARFAKMGVVHVPNNDKDHRYYHVPSGPIFRLAANQ